MVKDESVPPLGPVCQDLSVNMSETRDLNEQELHKKVYYFSLSSTVLPKERAFAQKLTGKQVEARRGVVCLAAGAQIWTSLSTDGDSREKTACLAQVIFANASPIPDFSGMFECLTISGKSQCAPVYPV